MSERTCIGCRHWQFIPGSPGSDVTPGNGWATGCALSLWELSGSKASEYDWRNCLSTAKTCPDFKAVSEADK